MDNIVIPSASLRALANNAEISRIRAGIESPDTLFTKILCNCDNHIGDIDSTLMALEYSASIARLDIDIISVVECHNRFNPLKHDDLERLQEIIARITLMLAGYNLMITKRLLEIKEGD